jgi:hypothetical protein
MSSFLAVALPIGLMLGACGHSGPRCSHMESDESECIVQSRYGDRLRAMNEKPLAGAAAEEAYRFLWLRTFHHPVSVRIESSRGKARLVAVELDGKGGFLPGKTFRQAKRELSAQEWTTFTTALDAAGFWTWKTEDPGNGGLDGADWVLEGLRHATYHVVVRWSPGPGSFRTACESLLQAAQFSFPDGESY